LTRINLENLNRVNFSGNCLCDISENDITTLFESDSLVHSFTYTFDEVNVINSFEVELQLVDWQHIDYLAIGYEADGAFDHIKVVHVRQNVKFNVSFSKNDLFYFIQNSKVHNEKIELQKLKVFIKGKVSKNGAKVHLTELLLNKEPKISLPMMSFSMTEDIEAYLFDHMKKCFRDYKEQALCLLQDGKYPMPGGKTLHWPINNKYPDALDSVNTYRFSWHAMHASICLLIYAREERSAEALYLAKTLIVNWLEDNFFEASYDTKFAWYDHGASERLICFLMLLTFGSVEKFDARFNNQLLEAISQHIDLLSHEGFYAFNQRERYHNHAWFQDIALLLSGLCFSKVDMAEKWQKLAISRLEDQIKHLIIYDQGYSIFVENSIGYHQGIQRICFFAGQLANLSNVNNDIAAVSIELDKWSSFFKYPNGKNPAQGDTFPVTTLIGKNLIEEKPYVEPAVAVLDKAGYAVVKGNFNNIPYMFCFFATSLSETHKHADNLSFTFFFDGIEWFIDPSFYSHEYEQALPKFLRSAWAHNTIAIEDEIFSIQPGNCWIEEYESTKEELKLKGVSNGYKTSVYRDLDVNLCHGELVIEDTVAEIDCTAYQIFQFGKEVEILNTGDEVTLSHPSSEFIIKLCFESGTTVLDAKGFDESRSYNGVSGLGFMQSEENNSVAAAMTKEKSKVNISIEAKTKS